jgi:predicted porin
VGRLLVRWHLFAGRGLRQADRLPERHSLVASYAIGAFSTSAATYFKHDASHRRQSKEHALGAAYQMEKMRLFGMVSQVGYSSGAKDRVTTGEIGLTYKVLPTVVLGAGLQAQKRRDLASADRSR